MENNDYAIVQIIQGFLGAPKSEYDSLSKKQWQFNCQSPKCRHDIDKFNLEYNSEKHVCKCWKCGYRGFIYKLVGDYGSQSDLDRVKLIIPPETVKSLREHDSKIQKKDHHLITCALPEEYLPLGKNRNTPLYKLAWDYVVNERKISPSIIDKYEIGYTETGKKRFRIIIPSKNSLGKFNYYEARSYMKNPKISYMKPSSDEVKKTDIIFNEYFINWDLPVFLVEGVFDMFRIPNSIPVLGKEISELLTDELLKHNSTVIICFDPDALEKTVETYEILTSLGLTVYYVDLSSYDKDISKIYEDHGKEELAKAISNLRKINLSEIVKDRLKNGKPKFSNGKFNNRNNF